jgi:hypothetical protein
MSSVAVSGKSVFAQGLPETTEPFLTCPSGYVPLADNHCSLPFAQPIPDCTEEDTLIHGGFCPNEGEIGPVNGCPSIGGQQYVVYPPNPTQPKPPTANPQPTGGCFRPDLCTEQSGQLVCSIPPTGCDPEEDPNCSPPPKKSCGTPKNPTLGTGCPFLDKIKPKSEDEADKVKFDDKQLQKKFKHANDFGVNGKYNPQAAQEFKQKLQQFINNPDSLKAEIQYRNSPVTAYVDPGSRQIVLVDQAGNFISGWRLSPAQFYHVIFRGQLGGG